MELLRVLLVVVCLVSLLCFGGLTVAAYTKRKDKSFWGGASILNGWWLLFPYDNDGLARENRSIVIVARITLVVGLLSGWLAYTWRP
jgi:hypothetical protein